MERSQYRFSLAALVVTTFFAMHATAAGPEPGHTAAMDLRQNTVRIEARFADETENGFGFIVGEEDGTVYAVTAHHVVFDEDNVDGDPPVVKVELFNRRGKMIEAEVLGTHDSRHDLAVITFPAPSGFKWNKKALGSNDDQNRLTDVWFVGKLTEWTVPTSPGTIASDDPVDGRIEIDRLDVKRGSSGGPLIAASGIVGMVITDSDDNTAALSISFIQQQFKRWNHPFMLQRSAARTTASAEPQDPQAAKGAAIAARDPLFAALREQLPEGLRHGYDVGMATAENQTEWGTGKQKLLDSLSGDEQEGFRIATYFAVDRNRYDDRAVLGAAIAEGDPAVAAAREKSSDPRYWLGFDIATAIFGDPKRGAQGNTATGPGSLGIRDSLMSPLAQKGFNASVAYHLNRKY